ncbi:hypothetical protein OUZ56_018285 [Daphnia magna]|uniref:Uncharacterized protein n=1 Tax=Daphnia magna TaxID=35525 RepID=A0ABQ9Z8G3_9CRUS|nr:hypothetical protein OUZ56_018207 [Daphnia magna]KAK4009141.1 hypothetical protein OUZ56_018213 [Daphnia magna]KAK4009142.1 hypothetical protein OUZ56_018219 [Daphnia magna]KAK4009182.1 hypothetical protein OUZ56_018273 [Daphnia magna]KAK4009183.1 hypothetical protein OUZ56_018279 [Daphnia magna]
MNGSDGIRTHASEETGALNQRLRPLGHATLLIRQTDVSRCEKNENKSPITTRTQKPNGKDSLTRFQRNSRHMEKCIYGQ